MVKRTGLLAIVPALVLACAIPALAVPQVTLSDTQTQPNFSGFAPWPPIATFDFTSGPYSQLLTLNNIALTLTLGDGDTAPGDFDFNDLTLALDGINTGILLNGFPNNATVTLTLGGTPANSAAILAALQADGLLVATIFDADPNDNFLNFSGGFETTLQITGTVPEPSSIAVFGLVALAAAGYIGWRRRK